MRQSKKKQKKHRYFKQTSININSGGCVSELPGRARPGKGPAGSSERADSWKCSLGSVAPVRRTGRPHPDWLGCFLSYPVQSPGFLISVEPSAARHAQVFPSWLLGLIKQQRAVTRWAFHLHFVMQIDKAMVNKVCSTCSRAVGLTLVAGRWHRWHNQVERNGNVHRSHVTWSCPNHSNLIVCLKVHVGWTSSWGT